MPWCIAHVNVAIINAHHFRFIIWKCLQLTFFPYILLLTKKKKFNLKILAIDAFLLPYSWRQDPRRLASVQDLLNDPAYWPVHSHWRVCVCHQAHWPHPWPQGRQPGQTLGRVPRSLSLLCFWEEFVWSEVLRKWWEHILLTSPDSVSCCCVNPLSFSLYQGHLSLAFPY